MSYLYAKFEENPCVGTDESTPLNKNIKKYDPITLKTEMDWFKWQGREISLEIKGLNLTTNFTFTTHRPIYGNGYREEESQSTASMAARIQLK